MRQNLYHSLLRRTRQRRARLHFEMHAALFKLEVMLLRHGLDLDDVRLKAFPVLVSVVLILVVRAVLNPAVYRSKSLYIQSAQLDGLKFVSDKKKLARGATIKDIPDVVSDMRHCFNAGTSLPLEKRREQLKALLKMINAHEKEILEALRADLMREGIEALYYDVVLPKKEISAMIKNLKRWTGRRRVWEQSIITWPSQQWLEKQPYGCALVCSTWNFPFLLSLVPLAGALAAGNTVVLRPSNDSRASTDLLVKLIRSYCDPHVVQAVGSEIAGNGVNVMQVLLKQKFDFIFFTGSTKVGKIVAGAAAETLTPTALELGGKNPVVVTDCADINIAAKQCIWGRTINCGQQCIAPEFVLCHESVVDEFTDSCKYWVQRFVPDASVEGSMTRIGGPSGRMDHIAKMLDALKLGRSGDQLVCGGGYNVNTRMVEPTVVLCEKDASPLMQDELFAPILCVLPYSTLDEVIDVIRSKPKPLTMYIFSRTAAKTRFILDNTHAGGVTVNGTLTHCGHDSLPFGGVGDSGSGRYHGKYSVECFQREKPVLQKMRGLGDFGIVSDPALLYLPHRKWKVRAMKMLL